MEVVNVLLADDEPWVIDSVRLALKQGLPWYNLRAKCLCATDIRSVNREIDVGIFDVAVLDMRFAAETTGLDLLARIKARDPLVQCIILTAYPNAETAVEAYSLGAYDYVAKMSPNEAISYGDVVLHRVLNAFRHSTALRFANGVISKEQAWDILTAPFKDPLGDDPADAEAPSRRYRLY